LEPDNPDSASIQFNNFYFTPQDYTEALEMAGLSQIEFVPFQLDPAVEAISPAGYWNDMVGGLDSCPTCLITAVRL
jgi:hypothetical protein